VKGDVFEIVSTRPKESPYGLCGPQVGVGRKGGLAYS